MTLTTMMADWDDSSTRSWEAIADDWVTHAEKNDYRNYVLMPLTFELLGDVNGVRILDLGCGEGGYARELSARGAIVVGVDGSARLIAVAKQRAAEAGLEIEFLCANASSLDPIPSDSFDRVLASMSLMDVEDYQGAIDEVARVLVPGGQLLMSITHPCFTAPTSEWIRHESGEPRHFAVDRYFERGAWDSFITDKFEQPVVRRHKPLEDFMAPLLRAGFALRLFHEPTVSDEQIKMSARLRNQQRVPYFLFMLWQKPE